MRESFWPEHLQNHYKIRKEILASHKSFWRSSLERRSQTTWKADGSFRPHRIEEGKSLSRTVPTAAPTAAPAFSLQQKSSAAIKQRRGRICATWWEGQREYWVYITSGFTLLILVKSAEPNSPRDCPLPLLALLCAWPGRWVPRVAGLCATCYHLRNKGQNPGLCFSRLAL